MQNLTPIGRLFFAMSIAVFGIQQFIYNDFLPTLMPIPLSFSGRQFLIYIISIVLIIASICIVIKKMDRLAATIIGILFLLLFLTIHLAKIFADPHNGGLWAAAFEVFAIGGGALFLARISSTGMNKTQNAIIRTGRYLFAISLLVFGIQHFIYADYISTLITPWIPLKLFWAYFVGLAFIATSVSIFISIKTRLATLWLGIMFLLWFLILHLPRAVADMHNENEWTSAFVALAMCGISFMISASQPKGK